MAEKRKCDNNSDSSSSNKKRAHKTHSFETKLDILKCKDNGEGETARSLGLSRSTVSTIVKIRVKNMEHVKSAGSLKSIMVNQKRSLVTEEMELLLKIWLDDQAQRRTPVSQAITSTTAKSLYYELKKQMVDIVEDKHYFLQPIDGLIGLKEGQICTITNSEVRLQVQTLMLPQLFMRNWLN
jgi:hypothetical protein